MNANPEEALTVLIDISQNFPIRSKYLFYFLIYNIIFVKIFFRLLVQKKVNKLLRKEILTNQETFLRDYDISDGVNALYINGINVDVDSLDIFQLYSIINKEEKLASAFYEMGFRVNYNHKFIVNFINPFFFFFFLERIFKFIK